MNLMNHLVSRRTVLRSGTAAAIAARVRKTAAQASVPAYSLPIGLPGRMLGDGFLIRHGYACENTWYNPGRLFPQSTAAGLSPKCMVASQRGWWSDAQTRTRTRQAVNASRLSA